MSNNILQPISPDFNVYLRENASVYFNSTIPAAPGGKTNIVFQFDQFGNVSAYTDGGGGVTIPSTTNLLSGNGTGGVSDGGIAPADVVTLDGDQTITGGKVFHTSENFGNTIFQTSSTNNGIAITFDPNNIAGNATIIGYAGITAFGGPLILNSNSAYGIGFIVGGPQVGAFSATGGFAVGNPTFLGIDPGSGNAAIQGNVAAGTLALTGSTLATSATAGAASALPVTPLGYVGISVTISGTPTTVKMPYYAV